MEIAIGQIIGDYEVIELVGSGGMGVVYKVRNLISERIDAMKILRAQPDDAGEAMGRFLREIKVQASLRHSNIAALYTAMKVENAILMFMEMVEGMGLHQKLRRGSLQPPEAVNYASQCLRALEYAHQRGVVHRDIKPSNIMITPSGAVKLLDFGIARSIRDSTLTAAGVALGSVHYMSPEQALAQPTDARTDVYSMGIMLYEMLIGARPFADENPYSVLKAHIEREPLSPAEINPNLPSSLCDAVMRALAKDREARFPSADAFREAIERAVPATAAGVAGAAEARASKPDVDSFKAGAWAVKPSTGTGGQTVTLTKSGAWEPQTLEMTRKHLADYLGPVAKVVVDRAARKCSTLEQLYEMLAGEIASPAERARFLATKPRT